MLPRAPPSNSGVDDRGHRSAERDRSAFTLVELLVVIAIIAVLASLLLPVLSRAKSNTRGIVCVNHLKQLSTATAMFVQDNEGFYPSSNSTNRWPEQIRPHGGNVRVLVCPDDPSALAGAVVSSSADDAPRSFLINGWNDYFDALPQPVLSEIMPETLIREPAETIVFGEKEEGESDFVMDLRSANEGTVLEQSRHRGRGASGGANYAFADTSVRFLKFSRSLSPRNLWAVLPDLRDTP